jgi:hypothetical protein
VSNFQFLHAEWPDVYEAATRAAAAVHPDPRTASSPRRNSTNCWRSSIRSGRPRWQPDTAGGAREPGHRVGSNLEDIRIDIRIDPGSSDA